MIRFVRSILLSLTLCGVLAPISASPQIRTLGGGGVVTLGQVYGLGQLGPYVDFTARGTSPSSLSAFWINDGTPAIACTFEIDVNPDNLPSHWFAATDPQPCTGAAGIHAGGFSFQYQPWPYVRVNILTYTPGDATTAVRAGLVEGNGK